MKFLNAQKLARENPNTFEVPTSIALRAIKKGDFLVVSNGPERFWVEVASNRDGRIHAEVRNDVAEAPWGTKVTFGPQNVYRVAE